MPEPPTRTEQNPRCVRGAQYPKHQPVCVRDLLRSTPESKCVFNIHIMLRALWGHGTLCASRATRLRSQATTNQVPCGLETPT